jgi:hypothetical protein
MKSWQQMLRENDPGAEGMGPEAAARMREKILRAGPAVPTPAVWPMRLALAAFACVVFTMSFFGTERSTGVAPEDVAPAIGAERRQIQFATPGGTRIIWEINPEFTFGGTIP